MVFERKKKEEKKREQVERDEKWRSSGFGRGKQRVGLMWVAAWKKRRKMGELSMETREERG